MQRQPNEMNTENPTTDDNEISAQKLCAGMMSLVKLDMLGGRAFTCSIQMDEHRLAMLQFFCCDLLRCKNRMIHDFEEYRRSFCT